jgi:serine protease Do
MNRQFVPSIRYIVPGALLARFYLALLLFALVSAQSSAASLPDFGALVENNSAAVVNIRSTGATPTANLNTPDMFEGMPEQFRRFFEDMPKRGIPRAPFSQAQGSGFIISEDGYILTNGHVVANAQEVFVKLVDRREFKADVIGVDENSDIALLKIDAGNLPTVTLGDSTKLKVGDWVLAIGSPFGFEYTATQGIVSALSRSLPDGTYVPFIQTDVAVNPGNSGGPLFDMDGNVIGINSQIFSRSGGYMGLSFAIPINVAMNVVDQLKTQGFVTRGWLGVAIQDMNQKLAESFDLDRPEGALVANVTADSPADKGGIQAGDVIVRFNNKEVTRSSALPPLVGSTAVGSKVPVEVLRDSKRRTLHITIGELKNTSRPLAQSGQIEKGRLGLAAMDLDDQQRQELGLENRGVLVKSLQDDSPAAEAGIQPEDVILSFNRKDVHSAAELSEMVEKAPTDKPIVVLVQRGQGTLFLPVVLPENVS